MAKTVNRKISQVISVEIPDTVRELKKTESGYQVLFMMSAGIYSLNNKSVNFVSTLKALHTSLQSKKEVNLLVDADSLEIMDVK